MKRGMGFGWVWMIFLGLSGAETHARPIDMKDRVPAALLILPFENSTPNPAYQALAKNMPDLLTASLSEYSDVVHVVDRDKLDQVMAEHALKWENVVSREAYRKVGVLAQAHMILRGSVSGMEELHIQAFLYNTATTQLLKTFESSGPSQTLSHQCQAIGEQLAIFLGKRMDSDIPVSIDQDPETNQQMMRGLGFYHQSQYASAIPEFMKVLEKHPRQADAKYWLMKSYQNAGLKEDAGVEAKEFLKLFPNDPRVKEIQGVKP